MFWDNKNDSDWRQRWKNGLFLKLWATNQTRDAVMPWVVVIALGLVVLMLLVRLFRGTS
jgi:hypothetical protein